MKLQKLIRMKSYISMKDDYTVCVRLFHHRQQKIVLVIQRVIHSLGVLHAFKVIMIQRDTTNMAFWTFMQDYFYMIQ